ncbi:MAG: hypothetical protein ACE5I2_02390 [Anaerolineae bacterium]
MTHREFVQRVKQYVDGQQCGLCGEKAEKEIAIVYLDSEAVMTMSLCPDCHEEVAAEGAEEIEG